MAYEKLLNEIYAVLSLKYLWPGYRPGFVKSESPDWINEPMGLGLEVSQALLPEDGQAANVIEQYLGRPRCEIPEEVAERYEGRMHFYNERFWAILPRQGAEQDCPGKVRYRFERKLEKLNKNYRPARYNGLYLFVHPEEKGEVDVPQLFSDMKRIQREAAKQFDWVFLNCGNVIYVCDFGQDVVEDIALPGKAERFLNAEAERLRHQAQWQDGTAFERYADAAAPSGMMAPFTKREQPRPSVAMKKVKPTGERARDEKSETSGLSVRDGEPEATGLSVGDGEIDPVESLARARKESIPLHLPRFMLAAPASGSGKTMLTCGVLQALKDRGLCPASYKCGPDYIDPMFHSRVLGTPSRNLDTFFTGRELTRRLYAHSAQAQHAGISVMEGVMGFYDGLGGITKEASSYDLARVTETPVILVVNAKGMSLSVIPFLKGFLDYQDPNGKVIRGVILNRVTKMTALLLKEKIEEETGLVLIGYVPELETCHVESRHLGLVTPGEITDLQSRIRTLAGELEKTLDFERLLALAEDAPDYRKEEIDLESLQVDCGREGTDLERRQADDREGEDLQRPQSVCQEVACQNGSVNEKAEKKKTDCRYAAKRSSDPVRIAVARDEAFCFYYQDNLELLEQLGAQIIPFSPLRDEALPDGISGLLLGGGYPELYARQLGENTAMKTAIRRAIASGIPYLAECGGFMYLHERMQDMEDQYYPMVGVIPGDSYRTRRLGRFGYITLGTKEAEKTQDLSRPEPKAKSGCSEKWTEKELERQSNQQPLAGRLLLPGETIRGHEFHYFDSTCPGSDYRAVKPVTGRSWDCIWATEKSVCGYPHLYYWSNPRFAMRFTEQCRAYAGQSATREISR